MHLYDILVLRYFGAYLFDSSSGDEVKIIIAIYTFN
jgi:hypothetical protein